MTFTRQPAERWHRQVPGARWFRADLHVHTLDDHPGNRIKVPEGLDGSNLTEPRFLKEYAKAFLRAAVASKVEVLALTPHAVKLGPGPESSATWEIVDCWNEENDDDGVAFREKIYAVFPGFEPNLNDGAAGVHVLFLFDPEIGRDRYLSLYDAVMNGRPSYQDGKLQMTSLDVSKALQVIDARREDDIKRGVEWDSLVLAPHAESAHGVLFETKKQVLEHFPCESFAAYEIKKCNTPEDYDIRSKPGSFLLPFMRRHKQGFFVGSDAYGWAKGGFPENGELGHRVTWLKLAKPRVEALRQAFLAADSRVESAYEKDSSVDPPQLVERADSPDPIPTSRPWLRKVTIEGGASFFGGKEADKSDRRTEIPFSPGLTCIIGASMTGKSTLLDGLRLHVKAKLPADSALRSTVQKRGEGLLRGGPSLALETPVRESGALVERWPTVFYTQNELQALMQPAGAIDILRGLAGARREDIRELDNKIGDHDRELGQLARRIAELFENRDQADQKKAEADEASKALRQFEDAGLNRLREVSRLVSLVEGARDNVMALQETASALSTRIEAATIASEVEVQLEVLLDDSTLVERLSAHQRVVLDVQVALKQAIDAWLLALNARMEGVGGIANKRRTEMERKLAEAGLSAAELDNVKALSRRAELRDSYVQVATRAQEELEQAQASFIDLLASRKALIAQRRKLYDDVISAVSDQFHQQVRIRRLEHAFTAELDELLSNLRQKGITQWWNGLTVDVRPSPEQLAEAIEMGTTGEFGTSETVAQRLAENFSESKRYAVKALPSEDRYIIEQRLDNEEYRSAEDLSGGRRVSLLLSLLLEMEDTRPLVIDQPEDELDNRVLWSAVLPALRRMKGRRQIILVTHNANIVVNGDADLVVQLEADANHGCVKVAGAIEDPEVRRAIVDTVDGGRDAFDLRKSKYGF